MLMREPMRGPPRGSLSSEPMRGVTWWTRTWQKEESKWVMKDSMQDGSLSLGEEGVVILFDAKEEKWRPCGHWQMIKAMDQPLLLMEWSAGPVKKRHVMLKIGPTANYKLRIKHEVYDIPKCWQDQSSIMHNHSKGDVVMAMLEATC